MLQMRVRVPEQIDYPQGGRECDGDLAMASKPRPLHVAASTCQKRRSSRSHWRWRVEQPTLHHLEGWLDDVWRCSQATKDGDSRHLNRSAGSPGCSIGRAHRRLGSCSFGPFACSAWRE